MRPRSHRMLGGLVAAMLVLLADQASKYWILDVLDLERWHSVAVLPLLNFTMVWNRGITFGLNDHAGASVLLPMLAALAVVGGLCVWMWRAERPTVSAALGAICGGAIGNVIDRLRFGAVVDFIHAHAFGWSWYVFNLADAAIVCGVGVLILDSLRPPALPTVPAKTNQSAP